MYVSHLLYLFPKIMIWHSDFLVGLLFCILFESHRIENSKIRLLRYSITLIYVGRIKKYLNFKLHHLSEKVGVQVWMLK